jgi:hypothetical protein
LIRHDFDDRSTVKARHTALTIPLKIKKKKKNSDPGIIMPPFCIKAQREALKLIGWKWVRFENAEKATHWEIISYQIVT